MPIGRPSEITEDVTVEICDRLVGGESLRTICKDERMPARSSVFLKMERDEAFRTSIARAREAQQEAEIDRTVDMADDATVEDHQVVKLRIWARQWRAAKLAPKKYGDKQFVEQSGEITVNKGLDLSHLSQAERDTMRALLTKGGE